jgi:putative CocE/NonD family hydrolase
MSHSGNRSRRYEVSVHRDVRIPTGDRAATLSGDLFLPVTEEPVPLLLTVLPYRRDVTALTGSPVERWFAARGYASLLLDIRGTGSSDGTARPPFDPAEADDALAAIAWAGQQPWCDGGIGMWGGSYGALLTMRTASLRPPGLRAIIAVQGPTDPELDFVHPGGSPGSFAVASWVAGMLFSRLMPPVDDFSDPAEQARWRRRLATGPAVLDLYRHGPGDPVWSKRRIDVSVIEVPALCVAGWRDLFVDGTVRAYEAMRGPKRLIAGPWMHVMPQECPSTPIDFLNIALSWWDRWLGGSDAVEEPAVSLYVQGDRPRWLGVADWPPAPARTTTMDLRDWRRDVPPAPDPTVGVRSGLWSTPAGAFGRPLDQHEDDLHSLCYTSPPLAEPLLISGRPTVRLRSLWPRVSVKLADVDPLGRSTLVCAGLRTVPDSGAGISVALTPTTYEIAADHRLRVVIAPGDFPRVWPMPLVEEDWPVATSLSVPTVSEDDALPLDYPAPEADESASQEPAGLLGDDAKPVWEITTDLLNETVAMRLAALDSTRPSNGGTHDRKHRLDVRQDLLATAHRTHPGSSSVHGTISATLDLETGEHVTVDVELAVTPAGVDAAGRVVLDGATLLDRTWRD